MSLRKVLLVDSSVQRAAVLEERLKQAGFEVVCARAGEDPVDCVRSDPPDIVVVEESPPAEGSVSTRLNAPEISRRLRREPSVRGARILVLSSDENDCSLAACRVAGVDQCLKQPLTAEQFVERLEAATGGGRRRSRFPDGFRFEHEGLVIDTDRHEVTYKGTEIEMTLRELQILVALAEADGRVLDRVELLERVGLAGRVEERNVDSHVKAVRRKLGEGGRLVVTVVGVGYKLRS